MIAHGKDREEARQRLIGALRELALHGVRTNQSFLIDVLESDAFTKAETFTRTLESREWHAPADVPDEVLLAAGVALASPRGTEGDGRDDSDRFSPWRRLGSWGRAREARA